MWLYSQLGMALKDKLGDKNSIGEVAERKKGFIGIDPSYKDTAIAYIDLDGNYGFRNVKYSRKNNHKNKNLIKFEYTLGGVNEFVDEIVGEVSGLYNGRIRTEDLVIGIEVAIFYGQRVYQLALLTGAIYQGISSRLNVETNLINVQSIRKLLNVPGGSSSQIKKRYIYEFWNNLGAGCSNTDESDALSVAYYLMHYFGGNILFKNKI